MKRAVSLTAALLVLLPLQSPAQNALTNMELCVRLAMTVLTGDTADQPALLRELQSRQEACPDSEFYMKAAQYRLESQATEERERLDRRERRRDAVIQALQQYSNTPQNAPPAPMQKMQETTNCRWVGQNWICNSW